MKLNEKYAMKSVIESLSSQASEFVFGPPRDHISLVHQINTSQVWTFYCLDQRGPICMMAKERGEIE